MTDKRATSFRLTDAARALLDKLAETLGISQTACLELAIRETAKRKGVS